VRKIAVLNQKGGVGKTTTVANLAAALTQRDRGVCLVDLDPQAHLTLHFGLEPGEAQAGIYEVLADGAAFNESLVEIRPQLRLCPSVIDLAAAEVELVSTVGREQILRDAVQGADLSDDYLMIDCPPSLGLLTLNALAAVDEVFIPLQPHFLALQGLSKLLETVELVQKRINPGLRVTGVILCMYESNTRLAGEVLQDLQEFFAAGRETSVPWARARIFQTVIRRNIKLAESPSHGQTIFDYEPASNGAADYSVLADEVIDQEAASSQDPPESILGQEEGDAVHPSSAADVQPTTGQGPTETAADIYQSEYKPQLPAPVVAPIVETGPAKDVAPGAFEDPTPPEDTPTRDADGQDPDSTRPAGQE
jgi:chromosome partitioning protein